jgi:hypothetical protein
MVLFMVMNLFCLSKTFTVSRVQQYILQFPGQRKENLRNVGAAVMKISRVWTSLALATIAFISPVQAQSLLVRVGTLIDGTGQGVLGRGFIPNSAVKFDGRAVETRFVNSSELRAALSAAQTARVGVYLMSVETPKPGGGLSEPAEFLVTFK